MFLPTLYANLSISFQNADNFKVDQAADRECEMTKHTTAGMLTAVLLDRIQKHFSAAINHTARMASYDTGSPRWYGAKKRAEQSEQTALKTIEKLRVAIAKIDGAK